MNLDWIVKQQLFPGRDLELFRNKTQTRELIWIKNRIPCLQNIRDESDTIILAFHGNGENFQHCHLWLNEIIGNAVVDRICVEYPGQGNNEYQQDGYVADSEIFYQDAQDVQDFTVNTLKYDPGKIIVLGRSIGSGPAIHLAAENKIGALILVSPYSSISNIIEDLSGNWIKNASKFFPNLEKINKVTAKTLIFHGGKDTLIYPYHTDKLLDEIIRGKSHYAQNQFRKIIINECDHNDIAMNSVFIDTFQSFIQSFRINYMSYDCKIRISNQFKSDPQSALRLEKQLKDDDQNINLCNCQRE